MFLRTSSPIYPSLSLVTLGESCRYVVGNQDTDLLITDPGASVHVASIPERLGTLNLDVTKISRVVVTHLDVDRVGGISLLRTLAPYMQFVCTAEVSKFLQDTHFVEKLWIEDQDCWRTLSQEPYPITSFEEYLKSIKPDQVWQNGETITIGDVFVRQVNTPGHTEHSTSFLISPYEFLIVDETFGYLRPNALTAPGADFSLEASLASLALFDDRELSGIGLSYGGAITGSLVNSHIESLRQNTNDLQSEVKECRNSGMALDDIKAQVEGSFYTTASKDSFLKQSITNSFEKIWKQLTNSV